MKTVTIRYSLSSAGQKASILSGGDGASEQTVTVEQDSPDFARALEPATVDSKGQATLDLTRSYAWPDHAYHAFDAPASASEILDAIQAVQEAFATKEADRQAERREKTLAVLRDRRITTTHKRDETEGAYYQITIPDWPYDSDSTVVESPESLAWRAELTAANEAAHLAWMAQRQADREAKAKAEAEAKATETARRAELGLRPGDDDYEIEEGALSQVPVWESHRRGKNWMAVIDRLDPKSPGGVARSFAEKAKGSFYYVLPPLSIGDAVEFGADYYTGSGKPSRDRWYGYVVRLDPDRLVLHKCSSAATALKAGAAYRESVAVTS
jgi:hypothetical protein